MLILHGAGLQIRAQRSRRNRRSRRRSWRGRREESEYKRITNAYTPWSGIANPRSTEWSGVSEGAESPVCYNEVKPGRVRFPLDVWAMKGELVH